MAMKEVSWDKDFGSQKDCRYKAYALVLDGKFVGSIRFKVPRDGAGRLYVQLHIKGNNLLEGSAGGYGYDRETAALCGTQILDVTINDDGDRWYDQLRQAGFEVCSTL
jgi:hypothetical protein